MNLPPEAKGVLFKVGEIVRFVDKEFEEWGEDKIFEIANEGRIGVEVPGLLGRVCKVYVLASQIEAK